ncbi:MAG: hypothetical protein ACYCSN_20905 [Acidobacteriaceae bacterium]
MTTKQLTRILLFVDNCAKKNCTKIDPCSMIRLPNRNHDVLLKTMNAIRFFAPNHQTPANRLAVACARMAALPSYCATTIGLSGLSWGSSGNPGCAQGDGGT